MRTRGKTLAELMRRLMVCARVCRAGIQALIMNALLPCVTFKVRLPFRCTIYADRYRITAQELRITQPAITTISWDARYGSRLTVAARWVCEHLILAPVLPHLVCVQGLCGISLSREVIKVRERRPVRQLCSHTPSL